jgi:hypothetical protein
MQDQPATDLLPSRESELYFELGGPAYRLMQRLGVIKGAGPSVARRSVAFIAITWLPLLVSQRWRDMDSDLHRGRHSCWISQRTPGSFSLSRWSLRLRE